MQLILGIAVLASILQNISAADLQGIQNATPAGIPLNSPSNDFEVVNNGDAALEEHKLGGYRPLYPPYFERNVNQPQPTYYDKEYYSRGAHMGDFDARLDRRLKIPVSTRPTDDVQVYVVNLDQQSQPQSVVQLQSQPQPQSVVQFQTQPQAQPQPQFQPQYQPQLQFPYQSQQYARGFSNYRTQQHETRSYFYSFRFPNS